MLIKEPINPEQERYIAVPWCRFFIPKIASPNIKPDDPAINEHIMYAKCIKGHVLKDANDWILCENLPAPDAKCWQEGGDTLFSLAARQRRETSEVAADDDGQTLQNAAPAQKSKF
ncbi:MAG TPA: hypothetical protein VKY19_26965 [Ktedonosporobacter sp.]|nr:hypothetical protein [Ktedonosporobacter sp.]